MKKKVALITGGSRGLGKAMALSLAQSGLDVIITYRSSTQEAVEVIRSIEQLGGKAVAIELDLAQAHAPFKFAPLVKDALQELQAPALDFLINNAGMGGSVAISDVKEEFFDEFLNVHFKGPFFTVQQLAPLMADGGGVINISSGTTRFVNPGYAVYASMKGAIEVLTKYQAKELGARGIRSNVVAPGPVETDFNNAAIRSNPALKERLSSMSPLGRVGVPEDIAGVITFLCSDAGAWINGQRLEVSGGINV
jgi:NAD(P)-dependent dehydrogenase (short-subunit alcohol dehydrogenase family)